jgi:hypothetical protein
MPNPNQIQIKSSGGEIFENPKNVHPPQDFILDVVFDFLENVGYQILGNMSDTKSWVVAP